MNFQANRCCIALADGPTNQQPTTENPTTNDRRPTTKIKKPRAGFPDTGLVSLTMTCLRYLVMNTGPASLQILAAMTLGLIFLRPDT
jgi:hypothetical protein